MKRCLSNILVVYCFFVYLFPFKAYGVDPRWVVFLIYVILFPISKIDISHIFHINNRIRKVIRYPMLMALLSAVGITLNGSLDFTFVYFPLQIIYLLLLAYCVFKITEYFEGPLNFKIITKFYIICLIIQSIIALAMFVDDSLRDWIFRFEGFVLDDRAEQMFLGVRLMGLGCFYFGGGLLYGLGLILLVPVMFERKRNIIKLIFLYLYLFAIGCFFARTCMIGLGVSCLLVASYLFKSKFRSEAFAIIRNFVGITFLLVMSVVSIYLSSPKLQEDYGKIIDFGFEAFINLSENGQLSTKSSDGLQEVHFKIMPEDLKTYIIGDSKWTDGKQYYKGTDVGYVRLLFFFGLGGVMLFLLYQYSVFSILGKIYHSIIIKRCFRFLFLYVSILLIKGYIDVASLVFIYLFYKKNHENIILR